MITKKEIKYLSSLKQKKIRLLNHEILIEGSKLILDAFKHKQNIKKIIYSNKDSNFSKLPIKLHLLENQLITIIISCYKTTLSFQGLNRSFDEGGVHPFTLQFIY